MAQPKPDHSAESMHVIQELQHRITTSSSTQRTIEHIHGRHQKSLELEQLRTKEIINELNEQITELTDTCRTLKRAVFTLGKQLRSKVNKRDLDLLIERIDALNIENVPVSSELEEMYNHYKPK